MSKTKITVGGLAVLSLFLLSVFVSPGDLFGIPLALAAPSGASQQPDLSGVTTVMAQGMSFIILLLNTLAWVVFTFLDIALRPSFIFGVGGGEFEKMLRGVWIWSRDIVNFLFAFIFLGAAVMTVVTGNSKKLIENAPKFVIALVLVNFTWFGSRVVIDIANVLANVVYNLPQSSANTFKADTKCLMLDKNGKLKEPCRSITDFAFFEEADKHASGAANWKCPMPGIFCYKFEALTTPQNTSGILSALVVNFGQLQNLTTPPSSYAGTAVGITAVLRYVVRLGLVLIIHVGIILPLVAMLFAFFIRIPLLWITIAFSPFVVLGYVLEGKMKELAPTQKILDTFLTSAFLPAMVGIPLSLGYMLIQAGMKVDPKTLDTSGMLSKPFPLFTGVSTLWEVFWLCMSIGILWMGVFWVLNKQAVGKGITNTIKGLGENMAKAGAQIPLSIPMLPAPGGKGEKVSLQNMMNMPAGMLGSMRAGESPLKALEKAFGKDKVTTAKGVEQAITKNPDLKADINIHLPTLANQGSTGAQLTTAMQKMKDNFYRRTGKEYTGTNSEFVKGAAPHLAAFADIIAQKIEDERRRTTAPVPGPAAPTAP